MNSGNALTAKSDVINLNRNQGQPAPALPEPDFHRLEHASFAWRTISHNMEPMAQTDNRSPQGRGFHVGGWRTGVIQAA